MKKNKRVLFYETPCHQVVIARPPTGYSDSMNDKKNQGCGLGRDVLVSRRTNVLSWSRFGLGAVCLGLGPVSLVSDLGPLHLVETFCSGVCHAYCSCSQSDTNQHDIRGLDIFVYSVFTVSFTYLS